MVTRVKANAPSRLLCDWLVAHPECIGYPYARVLKIATASGVAPFSAYVLWAAKRNLPTELLPKPKTHHFCPRLVIDARRRMVRFECDGAVQSWRMDDLKHLNTPEAVRDAYWSMGYVPTTCTRDRDGNLMTVVMMKRAKKAKKAG